MIQYADFSGGNHLNLVSLMFDNRADIDLDGVLWLVRTELTDSTTATSKRQFYTNVNTGVYGLNLAFISKFKNSHLQGRFYCELLWIQPYSNVVSADMNTQERDIINVTNPNDITYSNSNEPYIRLSGSVNYQIRKSSNNKSEIYVRFLAYKSTFNQNDFVQIQLGAVLDVDNLLSHL